MGALPNPVRKESNLIETATLRLSAALDALELAIEQRREADREVEGHAARVHAFGVDRSRLADELDRRRPTLSRWSNPIARLPHGSMRDRAPFAAC